MDTILSHCSALFAEHGNIFFVFFIGGLTGSLTHCLAMCGPVVACQAACGGGCGNRLPAASQWQYHGGRLLTYGALGFAASLLSRQLAAYSIWPTISAGMLVIAGFLFIGSGVFQHQHRLFATNPQNAFIRGTLMGFMPCGLLYAALMTAATIKDSLSGMIAMWFFVLGTTPALFIAGSGAAVLAQKWQRVMGSIGRIGLTFNGLTLLAMAMRLAR